MKSEFFRLRRAGGLAAVLLLLSGLVFSGCAPRPRYLTAHRIPENAFIYKHSTQCSISAEAAEEVRAAEFPAPVYWVDVLEQRELSTWLANQLGVKHESPQLIELRGGKAARVWNHYQIRRENFLAAE